MNDRDVIGVLNDLIETSKDGEYGFAKSAERVKAPALKETLQRRSADCARGAAELQTLVVRFGGKPEEGGSAAGALHRGWVSIKEALTRGSGDHAVLEECERGEDTALAAYRKALKEELPAEVRQVLERQMQGVQANHDQIKALRDSTPA